MDLLDELQSQIIPGDGAMGTLLMERGVPLERCFEELCVADPDRIRAVHNDYIAAGARIIETNSFGANSVRLARHGLENRVSEINWSAAQIARECARGKNVYVAGSVGPLGITKEAAKEQGIDRQEVYMEQIGALLDGGAQLIFLETFLDLEEIEIALYVKQSLHHCPIVCSLASSADGLLPDGTPVRKAFDRLLELGADIVGVNCVNGPQAMIRIFEQLPAEPLLSAFPNAGYPKYHEGRFLYFTSPDYFAKSGVELAQQGAKLIGGCCGTGPQHIAALAEAIKELKPVTVKVGAISVQDHAAAPSPETAGAAQPHAPERSILELIAEGRTVIVTELDPPKTLDLEKFYTGTQALIAAGSDAITLADNSLAILRISNLAVAAILKQRFGITPLLHLSCRDRNLLGLQSDLMGMAALGMRHVLPLTGDPAKVGDHPGATSVYDVTSIELIRIITQMNAGLNANGRSIAERTSFVAGCTFNPNARNMDAQLNRLERKLAAGAQYVLTQPVFNTALVEEMARRTEHFQVPVFTGVWPLLSGRQAEFLHNEVPGISIPDSVREAMRGQEGDAGREIGVRLAKDVCRAALDHFPGVYLITPFLRYDTTVELSQFIRQQ